MTARPVFVRLAAFFFAFAGALALVTLFRTAPAPTRRVVTRPARPEFVLAKNLESRVELVSLDREAGRSHTRLRLRLVGGSLPPEKLWVRVHFFNPSAPSLRVPAGEPVPLRRPFDGGGTTASVVVTSSCSWCDDADAPPDGYFANVEIYEHNYDERPYTLGSQFVDLTTAVPVVVHADRAQSRRR